MPPKTAANKRHYSAIDVDPDAGSSASEGTTRAAPKKKTSALKNTVKAIEAHLKVLDGKVRKMSPNSCAISTDTYADKSLDFLNPVKKLEKMDGGLVPAFNLAMYVADASHTDCDTTSKMSGYGDSEYPFGILDEQLLDLIEKRNTQSPATRREEISAVPKRWTRQDADVGPFKTGRPNKQQYGQMERQKLEWEKDRREKRRERRETVADWVAVALQDLVEERDYLEQYGVEKYFPKSIERLSELLKSGTTTAGEEALHRETPTTIVSLRAQDQLRLAARSPSLRALQPLLNCSRSQPTFGTMSNTQDTNSISQLASGAGSGSQDATNTTMTTEETLRAKIKLLKCQLQVCKEENARLRQASKIEAEFAEDVRLALEYHNAGCLSFGTSVAGLRITSYDFLTTDRLNYVEDFTSYIQDVAKNAIAGGLSPLASFH
ncbi:hypothetical protein KCU73_g7077, partial [Aureobasidium melanogenum]